MAAPSKPPHAPEGKSSSALVAGGLAGVMAKTVVAPLERIKIMFQVTHEPFSLRRFPVVMLEVYRRDGVRALWRGHMAQLLRVAPYSGIQFMVYDFIKKYFERARPSAAAQGVAEAEAGGAAGAYPDMRRVQEHMLAGAAAGSVSTVCTYPLDLARSRLAVIPISRDACHTRSFALLNYIRIWYRIGGIRELYRGLVPTVAGVTPYGAIAFAANDTCKETIRSLTDSEPTTVHKMMSGAFAGVFAQSITYPLEMVRRNMQTYGFVDKQRIDSAFVEHPSQLPRPAAEARTPHAPVSTGGAGAAGLVTPLGSGMNQKFIEQHFSDGAAKHKSPSFFATAAGIYSTSGLRGFFKGLLLNWIKGPITLSISFTSYDIIKGYLDDIQPSIVR